MDHNGGSGCGQHTLQTGWVIQMPFISDHVMSKVSRSLPDHEYHKIPKEKKKTLDKEIQWAKDTHWKEWMEDIGGNNI